MRHFQVGVLFRLELCGGCAFSSSLWLRFYHGCRADTTDAMHERILLFRVGVICQVGYPHIFLLPTPDNSISDRASAITPAVADPDAGF